MNKNFILQNIANTEKVNITEEIPAIRAQVQILKSAGVDIIIGLGHSGLDVDKVIAAQVDGLNLIVGGHSHDLLYTPKGRSSSSHICRIRSALW